jgi:hypothetical protein
MDKSRCTAQRLGKVALEQEEDAVIAGISHSADFSVKNARTMLQELTALGARSTGSRITEFKAPALILSKLRLLQQLVPPGLKLEMDVQHPSSNFYLDFLGGITNVRHCSFPDYRRA